MILFLYAKLLVQVATQAGVEYIDHTKYCVKRWQALGPTTAKTYFPNDNTHTSPAGAVSKLSLHVSYLTTNILIILSQCRDLCHSCQV
jgi:hypothetical protein